MTLNSALSWYQRKIGTYDKQLWEKTVEQRILKIGVFVQKNQARPMEQVGGCKGLGNVPKKTTRLKTELIDVDLVRGSAFPKAKPQHGPIVAARKGVLRAILLPLYFNWWSQQTNLRIAILLLVIYVLQMANTMIYFTHPTYHKDFAEVTPVEVLLPGLLMLALSVVHSQVVATVITNGRHPCRNKLKRKRLKRRSVSRTLTRPVASDRATTCTSFTFFYQKPDSSGIDATPDSGFVPNKDTLCATDGNGWVLEDHGSNEPRDVRGERKQGDQSPETDESASVTSESSPRAPRLQIDEKSDMDTRNDSAVQDISSGDVETDPLVSDAEGGAKETVLPTIQAKVPTLTVTETRRTPLRRRVPQSLSFQSSSYGCNSSCDSEIDTTSPNTPLKIQEQISDGDWGMTTNSECESYSSNTNTEDEDGPMGEDPFGWKQQANGGPAAGSTTCPTSDKVSCTIWEGCDVHKVDLSVLDISSAIIQRVDHTSVGTDYLVAGLGFSLLLASLPVALRIHDLIVSQTEDGVSPLASMPASVVDTMVEAGLASTLGIRLVVLAAMFNSFCLSMLLFFLLAVAERTFKQRFLYAKLFCHLTSARQARKSELPHFRLNKVRNIKTWLSVRSYLKRHGPQRSVDVIVSAAFMLAFVVICFLCFQLMKDSENFGHALLHWELVIWTLALGVYLLRLMTLGAKINKKYRNPSVLITEQINLYLQMEQKPHKKEGLTLANNVLKLAADLLKELESPFKISGLSANPYLYNITKLVILSAFSAVVKELLGFKLKLYKIKIK